MLRNCEGYTISISNSSKGDIGLDDVELMCFEGIAVSNRQLVGSHILDPSGLRFKDTRIVDTDSEYCTYEVDTTESTVDIVRNDNPIDGFLLQVIAYGCPDIIAYPVYKRGMPTMNRYKCIFSSKNYNVPRFEVATVLNVCMDLEGLCGLIIRMNGINITIDNLFESNMSGVITKNAHSQPVTPIVVNEAGRIPLNLILDTMEPDTNGIYRLYVGDSYLAIDKYIKGGGNQFRIVDEYTKVRLVAYTYPVRNLNAPEFNLVLDRNQHRINKSLSFLRSSILKWLYGLANYTEDRKIEKIPIF